MLKLKLLRAEPSHVSHHYLLFSTSKCSMHRLNKLISGHRTNTYLKGQSSLTMSHGELQSFRDAPLPHRRLRQRHGVQQRLGPRHDLELAVPAGILRRRHGHGHGRRRLPVAHRLAVQQLGPNPPGQRRPSGGLARGGGGGEGVFFYTNGILGENGESASRRGGSGAETCNPKKITNAATVR